MGAWLDTTFASFDYSVFAAFGAAQSEALTAFAKLLTTLGEATYVTLLGLLALVLCFFPRTRRLGLGLAAAIAIGTLLTNGLIKPAFDRIRPYNTLGYLEAFQRWYLGAGALSEQDYCFPSGHTTAATEVGVFLCLFLWRGQAQRLVLPSQSDHGGGRISLKHIQRLAWIPLLLAFLVGCSRVYLMVHYATDVLAGFIVGTFAGACGYGISGVLCRWIDSRTTDRAWRPTRIQRSARTQRRTLPPRLAVILVLMAWLAMYGFALNKVLHEGGTDLIRCDYDDDYRCQTEAVLDAAHPIDSPHYCEIHWEALDGQGGK